ncbi:hypothetical protein CHU92_13895 [Flavobacterium cyanobacteriorum]|uniref:Uncharacterized protein n=1 Tax=Flavobacterium cyanobacteriorum TaxID=2022802 RepID=A0A255YUX3_9FLAO|nr:hypothetical protein CHU92_13895 [Flavobacterium cyanobacteriorum]
MLMCMYHFHYLQVKDTAGRARFTVPGVQQLDPPRFGSSTEYSIVDPDDILPQAHLSIFAVKQTFIKII